MEIESTIIYAFITVFSLGLFIVSITSYRRYKKIKLLLITCVFLVFLIKGLLLSVSLFYEDITSVLPIVRSGLFDLIILVLLFIATLRR